MPSPTVRCPPLPASGATGPGKARLSRGPLGVELGDPEQGAGLAVEDRGRSLAHVTDDGTVLRVAAAAVHEGAEPKGGTASYKTRPAILLSIQKQPETLFFGLRYHSPPDMPCESSNSASIPELLAELTREEAHLADLERRRETAQSRVKALRAELAVLSAEEPASSALPIAAGFRAPATPAEKVRLFRALFRGREEIFPTRFVSKKTGKAGYAPACANKFVRGVCDLPLVRRYAPLL